MIHDAVRSRSVIIDAFDISDCAPQKVELTD
jgi:hypothetical protein